MSQPHTFWRSIEAIHSVVYFAPDAAARFEAIGLKGFWMAYMASRSAALGTPSPELVTAVFHGFSPEIVHRALPDAWSRASRDDILATRATLAADRLAPALAPSGIDVDQTGRTLAVMVPGLDFAGKPLAAAHAALTPPDESVGRLWWAATILREFRGDCHIAVLTAAGLDGASANALAVAAGLATDRQRTVRGWSESAWERAHDRLRQRGWLDPDDTITPAGVGARQQIEDTTDRVCAAGMDREATARSITVAPSLVTLARELEICGAISYPNPIGAQRP